MAAAAESAGLIHAAFFYRDDADYLEALVPAVLDGLAKGEPVLLTLPAEKLALLGDALGDAATQVVMSDMAQVARNPARTFPALDALCAQYPGHRLRFIVEPIWPGGRSDDEYGACVQNEALWNTAFAGRDVLTLCPYDAAHLPETVLCDARMTHPLIWRDGSPVPNGDYADQEAFARYNQPLPVEPSAATYTLNAISDLSGARTFTAHYAASVGLPAPRVGDLQLIVSELATNSLKYTAGGCRISLWQRGGELVCQVSDSGRLEDPLVGRRLPDPYATSGRGVFLVNALSDLVRIHTSDEGTTIQVHLQLDPSS